MKAFLCIGKQAEDPVPGLLSCGIMKRSPSPPRGSTTVNVNSKSNIGFADGTLSRETVRTGRVKVKVEASDDDGIPRRRGSKHNVVKAHRVVGASVQVKAEDDGHATGLTCLPSRAPHSHPAPVVPEKVVGIHAALPTSTNAASSQTPQTQALPSSSCENLVDAMHARPSLQSVSFLPLWVESLVNHAPTLSDSTRIL